MGKYSVAIDVGATNIKVALFDESMQMLEYNHVPTDREAELDRFMDQLYRLASDLVKKRGIEKEDILGVGAVFPSYVDYKRGMLVDTSYIAALSEAPVRDMLSERFGVRVVVDNDSNASAVAEHELGAGKGQDNMVYAALATGIGGGLILNGKLFRGMHGMAGEIGHIFVSDSTGYPCSCGVSGCVQSISSGAHMAKFVTDRIKEGEESRILDFAGTMTDIDMVAVGRALRVNDPLALEVVTRGAEYLGRMFHSVSQLLDINYFVYGGGIVNLGKPFIDRMIAAYRHYSLNDQRFPAAFVPAAFEEKSALVGAALLLREEA